MGSRGKGFQAEGPGDANSLRSAHGPCAEGTAGGRMPGALQNKSVLNKFGLITL